MLSIEGRVTAMASSDCGLFEILGILGTKLVFHTDGSFCCGDVMRFTRPHNEPLVCRRAGRARGAPARSATSPPGLGRGFWFHLLSHPVHGDCLV